MSPPALPRSHKERPMRRPRGKKPFQGVWRATLPLQVSTQQAGPCALDFPELSMTGPETGRGDENSCSDGARRPSLPPAFEADISPARGEIACRCFPLILRRCRQSGKRSRAISPLAGEMPPFDSSGGREGRLAPKVRLGCGAAAPRRKTSNPEFQFPHSFHNLITFLKNLSPASKPQA